MENMLLSTLRDGFIIAQAGWIFKRERGDDWEAALAPKAPPKPTRKAIFGWLVWAGLTKKGGRFDCASKLALRTAILFSARFTRTITRCVIGLPHDCVVPPAGVRRFSCGKNERDSRFGAG